MIKAKISYPPKEVKSYLDLTINRIKKEINKWIKYKKK